MCPLSGEGESQTGIDKEFCLYRGIVGPADGQFFQFFGQFSLTFPLGSMKSNNPTFHSMFWPWTRSKWTPPTSPISFTHVF